MSMIQTGSAYILIPAEQVRPLAEAIRALAGTPSWNGFLPQAIAGRDDTATIGGALVASEGSDGEWNATITTRGDDPAREIWLDLTLYGSTAVAAGDLRALLARHGAEGDMWLESESEHYKHTFRDGQVRTVKGRVVYDDGEGSW